MPSPWALDLGCDLAVVDPLASFDDGWAMSATSKSMQNQKRVPTSGVLSTWISPLIELHGKTVYPFP